MKLALPPEDKPLTNKQYLFVDALIRSWNLTTAAAEAGFSTPEKSGSRLLTYPNVKVAIDKRLKEKAIKADEVLERLAQQATLNVSDFYDDSPNGPVINWAKVREKGFLVKSIEYDRRGNCVLKFHDAQNALIHLGKHMKLFSDQLDVNILSMVKGYQEVSPDDWDKPNEISGPL